MRVGALWLVAVACLVLPAALAARSVRQDVTTTVTAAIPVTLSSTGTGSTSLGASATMATTTGVGLPVIGTASVLTVNKGSQPWAVTVRLVSNSGFGTLDNCVVAITDGTTTRNQVVVVLGIVTQSTGTAITLPTSGPNITILASGVVVGTGSFQLRIELRPVSGNAPVIEYTYNLSVT